MESRIKTLKERGDKLFEKKSGMLPLWQSIAEHFYPERASFTASPALGADFASHLMTSYPVIARRDLGNAFSAMLRPSNKVWARVGTTRDDRLDDAGRAWLEYATQVQRRAMYDRASMFVRATKEGDHDFAAFGQAVLSVELNKRRDALLYRCWHLRDVAWCENAEGKIDNIHRRWKVAAGDLKSMFKAVSPQVGSLCTREPFEEIDVRHVVIASDGYEPALGDKKRREPYVSIYFEVETGHILEEIGVWNPIYLIPRWQTVSGSQYAYSPATVAALADARLIQAMTLTILEAGEKAVNPPMVATSEVVRSDINTYAGGVTWVDAEYDERLGDALRTMTHDKSGLPLGLEMIKDQRDMIGLAFFLNRLSPLPATDNPEMTAFEAGQRIQDYIRNALPLFEPMEIEYNGGICENSFDLLLRNGAFGSPMDIPESLSGAEIQFRFESPLTEAIERQKGQKLMDTKGLLAAVADVEPGAARVVKWSEAFRDALDGIGSPAKWRRTEEQVAILDQQEQQQAQAQRLLATMGQGAQVAEQLGNAAAAMREAAPTQEAA